MQLSLKQTLVLTIVTEHFRTAMGSVGGYIVALHSLDKEGHSETSVALTIPWILAVIAF